MVLALLRGLPPAAASTPDALAERDARDRPVSDTLWRLANAGVDPPENVPAHSAATLTVTGRGLGGCV